VKRLNFKLKHKFLILILSLVILVSSGIMVSTLRLSDDGKNRVLAGVSEKFEDLQHTSIAEFSKFVDLANEGIRKASGMAAIEKIVSIAKGSQQEYTNLFGEAISGVSENVSKTLKSQDQIISGGLDDLLANSTDSINEIMEFDNRSQKVLANVAAFNVVSLKTSGMDGLKRLTMLIRSMDEKLQQMQDRNNEEIDTLLVDLITWIDDHNYQGDELIEYVMEAFDGLKTSSEKRKKALYQTMVESFELRAKVMAEELRLVTDKVRYAISRELENAAGVQMEELDEVIARLLEDQMKIQHDISRSSNALSGAINLLNTDIPEQLKEKGEVAKRKFDDQTADARNMSEEAKTKVAANVENKLQNAAQRFEAGIYSSKALIQKTLEESAAKTLKYNFTVALVCVILSVILSIVISNSIIKPINRIVEGLTDGAEKVASASEQVSSASQHLADGASEQAASLEETSSSLEEMASMTQGNADNAKEADNLIKEANRVVEQADNSMMELTTSIQEISEASEETSKIIQTIDAIAFQTNLLALNAAVEAARAGETGAGFAVVADEVRNLAMRVAEAAKNIAVLIEGTLDKVKNGSALVESTSGVFSLVAQSAAKVGELVDEITVASNEQAQGIGQVNNTVASMDQVTQQTAVSAEQSASAAEEMNTQAEQLKGFVDELVAVVGRNKNTANGEASREDSQTIAVHSEPTPIDRRPTSEKETDDKSIILHPAKEIGPDQIIPLDDANFKGF